MDTLQEAIDRMKMLECPTGELEDRVLDILEEYDVAYKDDISIERDDEKDEDGAEYYYVYISDNESLTIVAKSGVDDYVIRVLDAYIS